MCTNDNKLFSILKKNTPPIFPSYSLLISFITSEGEAIMLCEHTSRYVCFCYSQLGQPTGSFICLVAMHRKASLSRAVSFPIFFCISNPFYHENSSIVWRGHRNNREISDRWIFRTRDQGLSIFLMLLMLVLRLCRFISSMSTEDLDMRS